MSTSGLFEKQGFDELEAKLAELPNSLARGATTRAVKKGSEPLADDMRHRAPGKLPSTITVKVRNKNLTGLAEYGQALAAGGTTRDARQSLRAARGARGSEGTRVVSIIGSTAPHAHLIERGTGPRTQKTTGRFTGVMPANPFIRPAFDSTKGQVIAAVRNELATEIQKTAGRLAKKLAKIK